MEQGGGGNKGKRMVPRTAACERLLCSVSSSVSRLPLLLLLMPDGAGLGVAGSSSSGTACGARG
jgi:hypothetical protein